MFWLILFIIFVALVLDFLNGFHDAAHSLPTIVSTSLLSPLVGFILGTALMVTMVWIFRRSHPARVDKMFRRLQLLSAAIYSLGHGGNDAQKTMGIIVLLLSAAGLQHWGAPAKNAFFDW